MSSSASSSRSTTPESPKAQKLKRKQKETVPEPPAQDTPDEDSDSDSDHQPPKTEKLKRKRKEKAPENSAPDSDAEGSGSDNSDNEPAVLDEPALSHAERRRQKKEAKLAAKLKEEGGAVLKKRKLTDGTAVDASSSAAKRQNSVWVGNMSFKTQQENVRTFFKDVGEITRINMPTKAPAGPGMKPENRGFAYVDFATPEAKAAAIALSEHPLLGRKLLIKDGNSFEGRPAAIPGENVIIDPTVAHKTHSKTAQKILRAQKQPAGPTLFFGNLGFETTDESIRQLLNAHRQDKKKEKDSEGDEEEKKSKDAWIRKIRMGTFEDSGLCKGFAFVDFTSIDNATSALINPKNHHLNGRNLVVEYASPDAVRRGAPKSKPADGAPARARHPHSAGYKPKFKVPTEKSVEGFKEAAEPSTREEFPQTETDHKRPREKERSFSKGDGSEGVRHKGPKSRPKPGAALALAKRESAAIIPSQGQKITF